VLAAAASTTHTASYPLWYLVVAVGGAGGFGTLIWKIVDRVFTNWKGVNELLVVLRGEEGGNGKRAVPPLVNLVDTLTETVEALGIKVDGVMATQTEQSATQRLHGEALTGLSLASQERSNELLALRAEITPNGGNTNSFGDRMVRVERGVENLTTTIKRDHDELAARDDEVKAVLGEKEHELRHGLERHIREGHEVHREVVGS
jgi:hypothetical protein